MDIFQSLPPHAQGLQFIISPVQAEKAATPASKLPCGLRDVNWLPAHLPTHQAPVPRKRVTHPNARQTLCCLTQRRFWV